MAYWITHLRVAEAVLPYLPEVSLPHYYAGALGPDCGRTERNEDGSPLYLPGRRTSHWIIPDLDRCCSSIGFEQFYDAWMPKGLTPEQRSFYWGYYVHLITDAMWGEQVIKPRKECIQECTDEKVQEMKDDTRKADLRFLKAHPDYAPLDIIAGIGSFFNCYLDYYNDTDLENQLHDIPKRLHREAAGDVEESMWLADDEMDEFVMFATAKCIHLCKARQGKE